MKEEEFDKKFNKLAREMIKLCKKSNCTAVHRSIGRDYIFFKIDNNIRCSKCNQIIDDC